MKLETTEREKALLEYFAQKEARLSGELEQLRQESRGLLGRILQRANGSAGSSWKTDEEFNLVSIEAPSEE